MDELSTIKYSAKEVLSNIDSKIDEHNRAHELEMAAIRGEMAALNQSMANLTVKMMEGFSTRPTWRGIGGLVALVLALLAITNAVLVLP